MEIFELSLVLISDGAVISVINDGTAISIISDGTINEWIYHWNQSFANAQKHNFQSSCIILINNN